MDIAFFDQVLDRLKNPIGALARDGVRSIEVGESNKTYILTMDSGQKYAVRILKNQTDASARAEAVIQGVLTKSGLRSPQYLSFSDGDVVAHVDGEHIVISPFLSGDVPKTQTIGLVRGLGVAIAKIHNALADFPKDVIDNNSAQWFRVACAEEEIKAIRNRVFADVLAIEFEKVKIVSQKVLPRSVIHGDLFTLNVFSEGDEVTAVFDFETVEYTIRLFDIARTYLDAVEERVAAPHEIKMALFDGYNSTAILPLTEAEVAAFQDAVRYVGAASAAWVCNHNSEEAAQKMLDAVVF